MNRSSEMAPERELVITAAILPSSIPQLRIRVVRCANCVPSLAALIQSRIPSLICFDESKNAHEGVLENAPPNSLIITSPRDGVGLVS